MHELTITVDDTVYQALKPMVEQKTISSFLHEFMQKTVKNQTASSSITALRGTLHQIETSDLRDESDRLL